MLKHRWFTVLVHVAVCHEHARCSHGVLRCAAGLDSFASLATMRHLAALAHGPHACGVVVTLHQPRAVIWDNMLDLVRLD